MPSCSEYGNYLLRIYIYNNELRLSDLKCAQRKLLGETRTGLIVGLSRQGVAALNNLVQVG